MEAHTVRRFQVGDLFMWLTKNNEVFGMKPCFALCSDNHTLNLRLAKSRYKYFPEPCPQDPATENSNKFQKQ